MTVQAICEGSKDKTSASTLGHDKAWFCVETQSSVVSRRQPREVDYFHLSDPSGIMMVPVPSAAQ